MDNGGIVSLKKGFADVEPFLVMNRGDSEVDCSIIRKFDSSTVREFENSSVRDIPNALTDL